MKLWLLTFPAEKGIDLETTVFELEHEGLKHYMLLAVVVEWLLQRDEKAQEQVKQKLMEIDFHHQNPIPFFRHLTHYLINQNLTCL